MKKSRLKWIVLLVVIAVVGGILATREWKQFTYQGRSLQDWALAANANNPEAITVFQTLGPQAVPELIRLLRYDDPFWRKQARTLAPKLPQGARQEILSRTELPQAIGVRCAAARALGIIGSNAAPAVTALGKALRGPNHHQVKWDASGALWRIGKDSLPVLMDAMKDKDTTVLRASAFALAELGPDASPAVPVLVEALKHPDQDVRDAVNYSLSRIGVLSVPALTNLLASADPRAREAGVQTVLRLQQSVRLTIPALVKLTESESAVSRRQAVEALGAIRLPTNPVIKALTAALQDRDAGVRLAAANSLSAMYWRAQGAVTNLTACLNDESPEVRQAAERTLGLINIPKESR